MNGLNRKWEVGTDIGGTFTDIIAIRRDRAETRIAKVPSRPHAPVDAMLEAIEAVGLRKDQVERFVHGTTRITNAIVEDRLPKVALVATAGFEDVLDIKYVADQAAAYWLVDIIAFTCDDGNGKEISRQGIYRRIFRRKAPSSICCHDETSDDIRRVILLPSEY